MEDSKAGVSVDLLESELDNLIGNDKYFGSISEDIRKLVHKVLFVHTRLESELGMRIVYKLFEEQLSIPENTTCCLTETMSELIRKLTYTERLSMVRGYKDDAPYSILEKINSIRNDFGHPIERKWKDKYRSEKNKTEVLNLLIVGLKVMNSYMEKVKGKSVA